MFVWIYTYIKYIYIYEIYVKYKFIFCKSAKFFQEEVCTSVLQWRWMVFQFPIYLVESKKCRHHCKSLFETPCYTILNFSSVRRISSKLQTMKTSYIKSWRSMVCVFSIKVEDTIYFCKFGVCKLLECDSIASLMFKC